MVSSIPNMLKYFDTILQKGLQPEAWEWLTGISSKIKSGESKSVFFSAFTAIPRHTGKSFISFTDEEKDAINELSPGFQIQNYTIDRLARLWLILQFPSDEKTTYLNTIGQLFKAAEMNELVALYGALPLLSYPEEWVKQCAEGIRSNIGVILEAIMCDNPYPSKYLDQQAWNQLVLKAFFTEKQVNRIVGLDERANKELAYILSDYAHERWAAHRMVDPLLWRLTQKFIDERIFADLKKVFETGSSVEKNAAALACYLSEYFPAELLLDKDPKLKSALENGQITWDSVAHPTQINSI